MNQEILDQDFDTSTPNVVYASFWQRVLASIIDSFVLVPLALIDYNNFVSWKSLTLYLFTFAIAVAYKPYFEWKKTATIGKMALGLKVVNEQYQAIELDQALKRYIPWIINYAIALALNIMIFTHEDFASIDNFLEYGEFVNEFYLSTVSTAYGFAFILLMLSVAFDQFQQGVHDKFADTFVIVDRK